MSKSHTIAQILALYEMGLRDFAENRLQEALTKIPHLPSDIRWHFVGRLQRNKVRAIIDHFHLIHSVDSFAMAQWISEISCRPVSILLQANTSAEVSKAGATPKQWLACFEALIQLPRLEILGLMTMAPFTTDRAVIRHCFRDLKQLQHNLQTPIGPTLATLSMGMSEDFVIAIEEGSTLVRIGRALFD